MRPLRYAINITLDDCCDHRAIPADEDLHRHHAEYLAHADGVLMGRVTYRMTEEAWRPSAQTGANADRMEPWMDPFARTIDAAEEFVVSSTLNHVDWSAQVLRGDLGNAAEELMRESGRALETHRPEASMPASSTKSTSISQRSSSAHVGCSATTSQASKTTVALSEATRVSVMEAFRYPEEKRFQRFFALEAESFLFPGDRSDRYTVVEIAPSGRPGRTGVSGACRATSWRSGTTSMCDEGSRLA